MAEGSANGGGSLAGAEPSVDLELPLSGGLIGDELEFVVEMLEVASKLPAGSFHLELLGFHLNLNTAGNNHSLR